MRGLSGERPAGGAEPRGDQEHRLQLHPGRPRRPGSGALQPRHAARLLRHPAHVLRAVARLHPPAGVAPEHPVGLQESNATRQPVPRGACRVGSIGSVSAKENTKIPAHCSSLELTLITQ